jgi:hypothetical protein
METGERTETSIHRLNLVSARAYCGAPHLVQNYRVLPMHKHGDSSAPVERRHQELRREQFCGTRNTTA